MQKQDKPPVNPKTLAQQALQRFGGYYPAAKELGDPRLRAALWRYINEDGFKPPNSLLHALWEWANLKPVIIEVPPGSPVFGATGALLDLDQVVAILVMPPDEMQRHMIDCAVCGEKTPRWSSTQKYCPRHSWSTPEGRRWHRQQKKKKGDANAAQTL